MSLGKKSEYKQSGLVEGITNCVFLKICIKQISNWVLDNGFGFSYVIL